MRTEEGPLDVDPGSLGEDRRISASPIFESDDQITRGMSRERRSVGPRISTEREYGGESQTKMYPISSSQQYVRNFSIFSA